MYIIFFSGDEATEVQKLNDPETFNLKSRRYYPNNRNNTVGTQGAQGAQQALAHMATRATSIGKLTAYKSSQLARMNNVIELQWENQFYYIKGAKVQTWFNYLMLSANSNGFLRKINNKIVFFVDHYPELSVDGMRREILLKYFQFAAEEPLTIGFLSTCGSLNFLALEDEDRNRFLPRENIRFQCEETRSKAHTCTSVRYITCFEGALRYSAVTVDHGH